MRGAGARAALFVGIVAVACSPRVRPEAQILVALDSVLRLQAQGFEIASAATPAFMLQRRVPGQAVCPMPVGRLDTLSPAPMPVHRTNTAVPMPTDTTSCYNPLFVRK
jgi:hypothetical protein